MKDSQGMAELKGWISRAGSDPEKVDGYAIRLYERIRQETSNDAIAEAVAKDQVTTRSDEIRTEITAHEALMRCLMNFAGSRDDDTARSVYATIARFNMGEMFRPGGGADRYLIPFELTEEKSDG